MAYGISSISKGSVPVPYLISARQNQQNAFAISGLSGRSARQGKAVSLQRAGSPDSESLKSANATAGKDPHGFSREKCYTLSPLHFKEAIGNKCIPKSSRKMSSGLLVPL